MWEAYPSVIDGIRQPHVDFVGGLQGTINLLVTGKEIAVSGYGISLPALLYWVVDEFEYSVTAHGLPTLAYDGTTYIKRARRSKLLQTYDEVVLRLNFPNLQHFAFLGGGDCVEVVTQSEVTIVALHSKAERDAWVERVCESTRERLTA